MATLALLVGWDHGIRASRLGWIGVAAQHRLERACNRHAVELLARLAARGLVRETCVRRAWDVRGTCICKARGVHGSVLWLCVLHGPRAAWHSMAWHEMAWDGMAWDGMAWHVHVYPIEPLAHLTLGAWPADSRRVGKLHTLATPGTRM